ncbi:hypothetical protein DIRU0_E04434 [Diutina rugosa]
MVGLQNATYKRQDGNSARVYNGCAPRRIAMKRSSAALAARSHWAKRAKSDCVDEVEVVKILQRSVSPIQILRCRSASTAQNENCVDLEEILGDSNLTETFQFNFNIDVEFFLSFVNESMLTEKRPITFICGTSLLNALSPEAKQFNLHEITVALPKFGSHHTKMMVNFFGHSSMEIIIMTANLTKLDFGGLTQMLWRSGQLQKGRTQSHQGKIFLKDMQKYLQRYNKSVTNELAQRLDEFDFSEINVELVASVPGTYTIDDKLDQEIYGYGSLLKVLKRNNLLLGAQEREHKVLAQVSSIAYPINSKGRDTSNIFTHLLCPLIFSRDTPFRLIEPGTSPSRSHQKMFNYRPQIVYPTTMEVASSSIGFLSGQALHFNYKRPALLKWQYGQNIKPYLYRWNSSETCASTGRETITPHSKLYAVDNGDDWKSIKWAMMGSHNLSKQAWGSRKGTKFATTNPNNYSVSSYELSILCFQQQKLLIPHYGSNTISSEALPINFPFRVPPVSYGSGDEAWSWQNDLGDMRDSQGISFDDLIKK